MSCLQQFRRYNASTLLGLAFSLPRFFNFFVLEQIQVDKKIANLIQWIINSLKLHPWN